MGVVCSYRGAGTFEASGSVKAPRRRLSNRGGSSPQPRRKAIITLVKRSRSFSLLLSEISPRAKRAPQGVLSNYKSMAGN